MSTSKFSEPTPKHHWEIVPKTCLHLGFLPSYEFSFNNCNKWQLTTLWGLTITIIFYFFKSLFKLLTEPQLKNDCSEQRVVQNNRKQETIKMSLSSDNVNRTSVNKIYYFDRFYMLKLIPNVCRLPLYFIRKSGYKAINISICKICPEYFNIFNLFNPIYANLPPPPLRLFLYISKLPGY